MSAEPARQYVLGVNEEYSFYPQPLSREGSFEDLVIPKDMQAGSPAKESKALNNPKVRKQLQNLKPHYPWFLGFVSVVQVGLLCYAMYLNQKNTGTLIEMDPFNVMIGPSSGTLILMGARYTPCMRAGTGFDKPGVYFPCPKGIKGTANGGNCYLKDVCSFYNLTDGSPNQWYRFLTAVFLHGGWIHLLMNLSFQVQGGFALEKDLGTWRMALVYIISGVGGFVFGAGLSDVNSASVGASGSLYGMIACLFLDLLQNWSLIKKPWTEFFKMGGLILFSFAIGLLPYVDNLAHVGGFLFGLLAGLLLMPKIYFGRWDKRRKRILMILAIPALVVFFYIFVTSFYSANTGKLCEFCKYFNCIPGMPWCEQKWAISTFVNITTTN
jgi:membrane associated rhomboid family serine protease